MSLQVVLILPPVRGTVQVILPDGTAFSASDPLVRPSITILPPGRQGPPGPPASAEVLPERGTYSEETLVNRVYALQDRKAELTDLDLPTLSLIFDNQLL